MDEFDRDSSLDQIFAYVSKLYFKRVHRMFESVGLYRGQPIMLYFLWAQDGKSHKEIATHIELQPATISKMVQRMEKNGFLISKPDSNDMRKSRVYLTDKGRNVKEKVGEIWQRLEEEVFGGFTLEEKLLFKRFLNQIKNNIQNAEAKEQ